MPAVGISKGGLWAHERRLRSTEITHTMLPTRFFNQSVMKEQDLFRGEIDHRLARASKAGR